MAQSRDRILIEPGAKRVRTFLGGVPVADTVHPLLVWENPHYPAYYFPVADVRMDFLVPTATTTHSPSRGDATYFTVKAGTEERVDAAWTYAASPIEALRDHIRFDWDAMGAWFEEDEEVFVHVRSPYTRIDILPTSRVVRVVANGTVIADSAHARVLFETRLPPRWYVPKVDARMDLLVPSTTLTRCPYKGQAEHYSARIGDQVIDDVAWSYRTPLPESERIAGMLAFYPDRIGVFVDGTQVG